MEDVHGTIEGPVRIDRDARVHARIVGDAVIAGGREVHLLGPVTGDVTVEPGATVEVHGVVDGAVMNNGGAVTIFGEVGSVTGTHPSHIVAGAKVRA